MKKTIIFLLIPISICLQAQQTQGVIFPKTTFTNLSDDTLVYFPKQKLESMMDQEQMNKELITSFENRIVIYDSVLQLKTKEAENWYKKLLETDTRLKNLEIEKARKEQRNRFKTKLWFGTGVLIGILVCSIL